MNEYRALGIMQNHHADGRDLIVRHLLDAIRQVKEDVAKVELWAEALNGFSQPVPEYSPHGANVWFPTEQATALKRTQDSRAGSDEAPSAKKSVAMSR